MKLREKIQLASEIPLYDGEKERLEKIADYFAIEFAEWNSYKYKYLENKGWFATTYQLEMDIFITSKELLEIYKKEKGL